MRANYSVFQQSAPCEVIAACVPCTVQIWPATAAREACSSSLSLTTINVSVYLDEPSSSFNRDDENRLLSLVVLLNLVSWRLATFASVHVIWSLASIVERARFAPLRAFHSFERLFVPLHADEALSRTRRQLDLCACQRFYGLTLQERRRYITKRVWNSLGICQQNSANSDLAQNLCKKVYKFCT